MKLVLVVPVYPVCLPPSMWTTCPPAKLMTASSTLSPSSSLITYPRLQIPLPFTSYTMLPSVSLTVR